MSTTHERRANLASTTFRRAAGALFVLTACGTRPHEVAPAQPGTDTGAIKNLVLEEDDAGVMTPTLHKDWQWGAYIDRQGVSRVGMHSHDPATGNAR